MKTVFNFICLTAGVAVLLDGSARAQSTSPVERLAMLVDYVAADYPGAVGPGGKVLQQSELDEQKGMVGEASTLARELKPPPGHEAGAGALAGELAALDGDVQQKAAPERVAADCRVVHKRLIDDYGLVLAPLAPPDLARARSIFEKTCAECHGKDGRADTPRARELKPPPVDFHDAERMSRISPALAFHALTFGVNETAMASFEVLPPQDRWSLAFYVVSLRHQGADARRGEAAFRAAKLPLAPTPSRLSALSDQEIAPLLDGVAPADRDAVIAWLRTEAPFIKAPGGTFADARRLLGQLSAEADNPRRARELAIAAYLEGIEPHEAALRATDAALTLRIENAFLGLRHSIESGAPPATLRAEVARTTLLLDGADERGAAGRSVPFFAAFAIALREGFEISLLVAALLAFLRKSGHSDQSRYVHLGWTAAIPAGLLTWFVVGAVLGGASRELTEGVLTLVAAGMLLFVSHFVLGKMESRKWLKFLERKTTSAANAGAQVPLMLAGVAFVAAYREAIEIVLFFKALVLDSPEAGRFIALGALGGVAVLVLIVRIMNTLGRRLNPRPLMLVSSVLLTAIAVSLVGQGVRALQEGGYLHLRPVAAWLNVPVLGVYPSLEGLLSQLIVLALVIVPTVLEKRRAQASPA